MTKEKLIPLPSIDILIEMYKTMSIVDIADETGCSYGRIRRCFMNNDVSIRSNKDAQLLAFDCKPLPDINELVSMYESMPISEISNKTGCSEHRIRKALIDNSVHIRDDKEASLLKYNCKPLPPLNELVSMYETMNIEEIADITGCSTTRIRNEFINNNISLKSNKEIADMKYEVALPPLDELVSMYETMSINQISDKTGCSWYRVHQCLIDNNVPIRGVQESKVVFSGIEHKDVWMDFNKFIEWIKETYNMFNHKITSGDVMNYFNVSRTRAVEKLHQLDDIDHLQKYYNINESYFERLIEEWLIKNNLEYDKNNRKIIKNPKTGCYLELDFYLPDRKIAIEMNDTFSHNIKYIMNDKGWTWSEAEYYHQLKTDLCAEHGIQLIHIFENKLDQLDIMLNNCKPPIKNLNARDLTYKHDVRVKEFIETYHQQKKAYKSTGGALFTDDGEMVGVITFRKYKTTDMLELEKLCFKTGYNVRGGSSKLFKNYFKYESIPSAGIVTFSNTSYNTGNVYDILGFKPDGKPTPSVYWTNGDTWIFRWDRTKQRLKKRFNLTDDYIKNHKAKVILEDRGFVPICDTFVQKYVYNPTL